MKIEKINENQIRCTLTREDLASRHIKLSELAYGTEKARRLFREMMEQASYEFGFEAEDIPLMIEAIPLSTDSILLIVTKVEYPEELDTRFSRFSEDTDVSDMEEFEDILEPSSPAANDIVELFNKAKKAASAIGRQTDAGTVSKENSVHVGITKMFVFSSLDDLIQLSHILSGYYKGRSALFKNPKDSMFYLIVSKSNHSPEEFHKVCNVLAEYGSQRDFSIGQEAYFKEHYNIILSKDAVETLSKLS